MAATSKVLTAPKPVRCAIYTRKSTDEGLSQDFNSLHAQREAGEAFVCSQRHEGWLLGETRYDDGGFTGADMNRPTLKRLLADIDARKIDCVVVYTQSEPMKSEAPAAFTAGSIVMTGLPIVERRTDHFAYFRLEGHLH